MIILFYSFFHNPTITKYIKFRTDRPIIQNILEMNIKYPYSFPKLFCHTYYQSHIRCRRKTPTLTIDMQLKTLQFPHNTPSTYKY